MIVPCLAVLGTEEDWSSFEEIYMRYRQKMYAVAYDVLHNAEDAEDAVQQAFVSIADNFEKIKAVSCQELPAYIVIIVRNKAINIYNYNSRKAKQNTSFDEAFQIPVEVNYFAKFEHEKLVSAIRQLPQIYKDIIYMYYMEEFSAREIAGMLDISLQVVWKRAERAKILLKEILDGEEE